MVEAGFVPVSNLHVGMHLVEGTGQIAIIEDWLVIAGSQTMYNLTVQQDHTYTVGNGQFIVHNEGPCGFESEDKLNGHFGDHGAQFGASNAQEYGEMAQDFMNGPREEGTLEGVRKFKGDGDTVRYNPQSNTFGAKTNQGVIKTFFKPDEGTGIDYFYKNVRYWVND